MSYIGSSQLLTRLCREDRRSTCITVTMLGILIPVVLLSYLAFGQGVEPKTELRQVHLLYRHGDRNPTDTYPSDPYNDVKYWVDGWGALTNKGKSQLYKVGKYLRSRYRGFLSEQYSPEEIMVVSSDHDRCLMSAQVCLAGLYPPKDRQVWDQDLMWQPVPVHTTPRLLDKLIVVKKPCPEYDRQLNATYTSRYVRDLDQENEGLYTYLSEHAMKPITSVLDVEFLYNTLEIESNNNLKLPEWTSEVFPDKMKTLATISLELFTHTQFMKKIKGGMLLKEISQHMSDLVLKRNNKKMYMYSGHDLTLVNLMRTLGLQDSVKPDPGAMLIIELHLPADGSNHLVHIYYLTNTDNTDPSEVQVPNCDKPCTLTRFLEVTKQNIPQDWERECGS